MSEDCLFCKIIAGEIPGDKVLENEKFIVINDVNPQTEGHCLIIPKKHFDSLLDLEEEFYDGLLRTINEVARKIGKDFNLVVNNGKNAGQIVSHLHVHLIPRTMGDGFKVNV